MAARALAAFVTATTRGDAALFDDRRACAMLTAGLQFYRQALQFECYAFAILPAELQLLIKPKPRGGGVSEVLKNVKGLFAGKYNKLRGTSGQVGAMIMGLGRALVLANSELEDPLRDGKFLTRDSRMVERKKYGRKKARKSFQFSKR